jgi:gluconolactonase
MKRLFVVEIALLILFLVVCSPKKSDAESGPPVVEILSPEGENIISKEAQFDTLASGFDWTEGPVWVEAGGFLLFSDIPPNKIFKWSEEGGLEDYLFPSGYTGDRERGGEPGSNGLLIDSEGKLVMCQHGDRRMAYMNAPISDPKPEFVTMVDNFEGRINNCSKAQTQV